MPSTPFVKVVATAADIQNDNVWYDYTDALGARMLGKVLPAQRYITGSMIHELKRSAAMILEVRASSVVWQVDVRENTFGTRTGFLVRMWAV